MTSHAELAERYKRFRCVSTRLNTALLKFAPKQAIEHAGRRLGLWHDGMLVLKEESDVNVLMDYVFYDCYQDGANAIDRYVAERPPAPGSDEEMVLRAKQQAFYAVIQVEEALEGLGVRVRDLLTDARFLLADVGFSKTAVKGSALAARLIPFEGFVMTSGAALPLDADTLSEVGRRALPPDLGQAPGGFASLPKERKAEITASILRLALRAGASTRIRFVDVDEDPDGDAEESAEAKPVAFQPAESHRSLPWEALGQTEGDIPWAALKQIADALAADRTVLDDLTGLYHEFMSDPAARRSYECLYVPGIIALAADRLSDDVRMDAARFLLSALLDEDVDEEANELCESLAAACGALGPSVTAMVLDAMPASYAPTGGTFHLWELLALAAQSEDPSHRRRAIAMATDALERALRGELEDDAYEPPVWLLGELRCEEARPLMRRLYEQTHSGDVRDAMDAINGKLDPDLLTHRWDEAVEEWLEEQRDSLRSQYAGLDGDEEFEEPDEQDDEDAEDAEDGEDGEDGERMAAALVQRFLESPAVEKLSPAEQEDAGFIVEFLLTSAWDYEGKRPQELDKDALRKVLLDLFPRKVTAEAGLFEHVAPVTQVFLGWLEAEGVLVDAAPLIDAVGKWRGRIVAAAADPSNWGMGKSFGMAAQAAGMDLSDPVQMRRFQAEYNRRLRVQHERRQEHALGSHEPAAPIVSGSPKVGRNDPCPCGSGKKYKKCCGR